MSKELTPAQLADLIAKQSDTSLVKDILAKADKASAIEKKGSNAALRKAAHRKALADNDKIELAKVSDALKTLLPLGKRIAKKSDEIMDRGVTEAEAVELMQSYLNGKIVAESQSAIQDLIKTLVYRHMDMCAAEQGEEFPEQTNMILEVPELGKKFCREGAGRKDAEFDMNKLEELLGTDLFDAITVEKIEVTRVVDESKLSAAVLANPAVMELMRDAVVPGEWKTTRLMVRDITPTDKE